MGLWPNRKVKTASFNDTFKSVSYNYHHLNPTPNIPSLKRTAISHLNIGLNAPSSGNAAVFCNDSIWKGVFPPSLFVSGRVETSAGNSRYMDCAGGSHSRYVILPVSRRKGERGSVAFPQQTMEICTYWLTQKRVNLNHMGSWKSWNMTPTPNFIHYVREIPMPSKKWRHFLTPGEFQSRRIHGNPPPQELRPY